MILQKIEVLVLMKKKIVRGNLLSGKIFFTQTNQAFSDSLYFELLLY